MRSMTGYGQATWNGKGRSLTVEIRAVNQRFLEIKFNMPREYLPWESELRALVQAEVSRGKLDVAVFRGGAAAERVTVEPNIDVAKAYVGAWRQIQRAVRLPGNIDLAFLQGRPELFRVGERRSNPEEEMTPLRATLRKALRTFNRERLREGQVLGRDMMARVRAIDAIQRRLVRRVGELTPQLAARLRDRLTTLLANTNVAEERIMQEAALLAERSDVTEELVRLSSHLQALSSLLRAREPIGKKIDFLLQEVHREVNTIASKSADLEVTNATLEARGEIEKLREQTQNLE